jgi:hypothetical protein
MALSGGTGMALRLPPSMATYVPTTWAIHPVGTRVWLPREGRYGRVIVQAHGGLLYGICPEDPKARRLLERSACELEAAGEAR